MNDQDPPQAKPFAIMRMQKLKGGSVIASDAHIDRSQHTPKADPALTPQNIYLIGERNESLRAKVDETICHVGIKKRSNAVECVEFLFTASPGFFAGDNSPIKVIEFARHSKQFMNKLEEHGMVFVKAAVHLDEQTPHIVAYGIPLNKRGRRNARGYFGDR
ncbi:MAG: plasmid recombination protein [Pyrinomonadaceae bacterium]